MPNRRANSIKNAVKEGNSKGLGKYRYVDLEKLERMGIAQYHPEDGPNFVAIIPPNDIAHQEDAELPMFCREIKVHRYVGVNSLTFLCMKEMRDHVEDPETGRKEKWNLPCPICEMAQQLKQTNPDSELIKELRPETRFLFFVVDVSSVKKDASTEDMERLNLKVQWWDAANGVRTRLVNASSDPRSGEPEFDVADPDEGRTVIFKRVGAKAYKCEDFKTEARNPIPDAWLDQIEFEFDDILKFPEEEDVRAEVQGIPAEASSEPAAGRRGRRIRGDAEETKQAEAEPPKRATRRRRAVEQKQEEPEPQAEPVDTEPEDSEPEEAPKGDERINNIREKIQARKRGK